MIQYKKLTIIFALFLVGCDEKIPSEKTIKNQITKQISENCSIISLSDFEKVNGFPQENGSFIEKVKYSFKYSPANDIKKVADSYFYDKKKLISEVNDYKSLMDSLSAQNCVDENHSYFESVYKGIDSFIANNEYGSELSFLSDSITNMSNKIKDDVSHQGSISSDEVNYYIDSNIANINNRMSINSSEMNSDDYDKIKKAINFLNSIKEKNLEFSEKQNNCYKNNNELINKNRELIESGKKSSDNLSRLDENYSYKLGQMINDHCPWKNSDADDGVSYLKINFKTIESYSTPQTINVSRDIIFIKSDNGWVIK